ncbi:hypothetical protein F5Y16DRAFT_276629 [Xylariaceae sp. FL0255]|nr:hypothetical protein F5Y16DRAFT_276629 [Xylariaceae sp. FL0255]
MAIYFPLVFGFFAGTTSVTVSARDGRPTSQEHRLVVAWRKVDIVVVLGLRKLHHSEGDLTGTAGLEIPSEKICIDIIIGSRYCGFSEVGRKPTTFFRLMLTLVNFLFHPKRQLRYAINQPCEVFHSIFH